MKQKKDLTGAVIEIDDVEYLIHRETAIDILDKKEFIQLERLFDNAKVLVALKDIELLLSTNIVDYVDVKK